MPRAVIGKEFGPPESYAIEQFDPGPPGEGQLRLAIKAAGVSFVDVLTAMGQYQFHPPLPFIPGSEYAGIVEAVGAGVAGFAAGDRVFGSSMGGIFAEANNFPAANVNKVPGAMTLEAAAVFPVNYLTAYYALADRGRAKPGETLLVLGAAGGTGFAAIQVGKHLGLRVIASASSPEKQAAALAGGADAVVTTGAPDWRDQVKAANHGQPIDIVFDGVGGDATELAFRTLGYDGRHLVIGFPAGIAALKTNLPLLKSASLVGVQMRDHSLKRPQEAEANRRKVMELAGEGIFNPTIAERYPIEDYVTAMNRAFSGKAAGRVVLVMD
ncbi:NADPH:quinone oxidoreductase family protein [Novosphingobium album (ex Liu et al. 2023)]|uniref:NADPH:quinone oxidoreductase family protein n=1 Tax=Novosphingobium album (ex Liu et al. 2023) TaxID=3031130 RepID=A0ABT5WUD8_9SPHN|nr:NADPH:quinone oxidoreductase family protein [Novosphingobium album (ex Liu et al. 2023)]MDE8653515.1 NADPH:quinone oxidoreductase family protein [Novosphingobium album (ex Liu et al. 2023)]